MSLVSSNWFGKISNFFILRRAFSQWTCELETKSVVSNFSISSCVVYYMKTECKYVWIYKYITLSLLCLNLYLTQQTNTIGQSKSYFLSKTFSNLFLDQVKCFDIKLMAVSDNRHLYTNLYVEQLFCYYFTSQLYAIYYSTTHSIRGWWYSWHVFLSSGIEKFLANVSILDEFWRITLDEVISNRILAKMLQHDRAPVLRILDVPCYYLKQKYIVKISIEETTANENLH